MIKIILMSSILLICGIYLYPSSSVQIVQWDNLPENPQYSHYLILYPGETHVGTISRAPSVDIMYIRINGPIYDKWSPRLLSKEGFKNCTFTVEDVSCTGRHPTHTDTLIRAPDEEIFDMRSNDTLYLARAYEKKDPAKSIELYKTIENNFISVYRIAVLTMDIQKFLSIYHQFPHRKEPLYYLARHERTVHNYSGCLLYARAGLMVGSPIETDLYVEHAIYQYGIELELAHCLYHSDRKMEAFHQWQRILSNVPNLPESVKLIIQKNLKEGY